MTHLDIIRQVKERNFHPVYFLHGTEPYYIDLLAKYFEDNVLQESERPFNQLIIYGKEATAKQVIDTACRYPMMASHQLVILKEAQEMKSLGELKSYLSKAVPTTILVICHKHKKYDMRTSFGKLLAKKTMLFESKPEYDSKMPAWINNYLKSKKMKADGEVNQLLADFLGNNLSKVANELDKLAINLPKGAPLTKEIVQEQIGISKDYNVFELQKALGYGDQEKSQRIVRYFQSNPKNNPLVMTLASLNSYFTKVYLAHYNKGLGDRDLAKKIGVGSPFFIPEYRKAMQTYPLSLMPAVFSILQTYDLKSKGVGSVNPDHGVLLQELVWALSNAGSFVAV